MHIRPDKGYATDGQKEFSITSVLARENQKNTITIFFNGLLYGASVTILLQYLKQIAACRAERWVVHFGRESTSDIISLKTLIVLRDFAKKLSKKGCTLEFMDVPPHLFATLHELEFARFFKIRRQGLPKGSIHKLVQKPYTP